MNPHLHDGIGKITKDCEREICREAGSCFGQNHRLGKTEREEGHEKQTRFKKKKKFMKMDTAPA